MGMSLKISQAKFCFILLHFSLQKSAIFGNPARNFAFARFAGKGCFLHAKAV